MTIGASAYTPHGDLLLAGLSKRSDLETTMDTQHGLSL